MVGFAKNVLPKTVRRVMSTSPNATTKLMKARLDTKQKIELDGDLMDELLEHFKANEVTDLRNKFAKVREDIIRKRDAAFNITAFPTERQARDECRRQVRSTLLKRTTALWTLVFMVFRQSMWLIGTT